MKSADDHFDAANFAELHGRYSEANAHYEKALELQPDFPEALDNRAANWVELEEYAKAIADYERLIDFWPQNPEVHGNLAQIYVSAEDISFHDYQLALYHATRACELCLFSEFRHLSTLAAAHAANGQYAKAISLQKQAIKIASREFEAEVWVPVLNDRLIEYRQKYAEQRPVLEWFRRLFRR